MAKIIGTEKKTKEQFVRKVVVHWYDIEQSKEGTINPLEAKYFPGYIQGPKRRRVTNLSSSTRSVPKREPWTQTLDTDTILMTFDSLKRNHTLPLNVVNKLSV